MAHYLGAEVALRDAGRRLELIPDDDEAARLARVVFRLAQRCAADSGRLDAAA